MLKPTFIDAMPDRIVELMGEVEADMLATVARHLAEYGKVTGTAEYLTLKQRQYGLLYNDLTEIITEKSGLLDSEIERIYKRAAITSTTYDAGVLNKAGLDASRFTGIATQGAMNTTLSAAIARAKSVQNLTNTQCLQGALTAYTNAVDKAYLSVTTGAQSVQAAYKQALAELAQNNITIAEYTRGGKVYNYSIEANVRRNIMTSVNQTVGQVSLQATQLAGCNLVDVSWHAGARPSHEEWQGKRYWTGTKVRGYENFEDTCGFGEVDGICGINCAHSFSPADPDIDEPQHDTMSRKENNDLYNAQQKQRYYERQIRAAKKEKQVYEAAGDKAGAAKASAKIGERQKAMRDFLDQNPVLTRHYDREFVQGQ